MRKIIIFLGFLVALQLMAQEKSIVTVRASEVNNGVVIVTVRQATPGEGQASFELHCNKGAPACKGLEPGNYIMVRLPKNWGMYDCANVEMYATSADPETSQKLAAYCLIDK